MSGLESDKPHETLLRIRLVSNLSTSIDPGSFKIGFLVPIQNAGFVGDNGTNQTKLGHRGRKPVSKKLLGRCTNSAYQVYDMCILSLPNIYQIYGMRVYLYHVYQTCVVRIYVYICYAYVGVY